MNAIGLSLLCVLSSADVASVGAIRNLDHKSFAVRERATKMLARRMPEVRLLLEVARVQEGSPERRHRAMRVVAEWRPSWRYQIWWWLSVAPKRWPHFDMIAPSMFPFQNPGVPFPTVTALDLFGCGDQGALFRCYFDSGLTLQSCGPDFQHYRTPTALYVLDLMRAGHQPGPVKAWLLEMAVAEDEWYRRTNSKRPE